MKVIKNNLKLLAEWVRKWRKKPPHKGFSLIELLVVVGITGILSAIAIPQYNKYRANAARGALGATVTNVARAFQACISVNTFDNCTGASSGVLAVTGGLPVNLNTSCPTDGDCNHAAMAPHFCVDLDAEIAGETFHGCVTVDASAGETVTNYGTSAGTKICYDESNNNTSPCTNSAYQINCDTAQSPLKTCLTAADCGAGNYCEAGSGGECQSTGMCN